MSLHTFVAGQTLHAADLNNNFAIVANGGGGGGGVNTAQQYTFTNVITFASNLVVNASLIDSSNSAGSNGQVLASNGTAVVWQSLGSIGVNTSAQYTWSNTQTFTNTITFNSTINGTANNSLYIGGLSAANVVSNAQLTANLALYSNTALMLANDATTYSNAVAYVTGQSFVNSSQLTSNLANYQTIVGLAANVATMTSNNSNYLGGIAAASYVQNTDSRTLSGNLVISGTSFNPASNTVLLGNSSALWVISANSLTANSVVSNTLYTNGMIANSSGLYPISNTVGFNLGSTTNRWAIVSNGIISSGTSTFTSGLTVSAGSFNFSAAAGNFTANSQTTGVITIGGPLQTGPISIGTSTANQVVNIATGSTTSGNVKILNIGTAGAAGSQTNITIGTNLANSSVVVYSNSVFFSNDTIVISQGNSSVNTTINSTSFSGTANNTLFVGSIAAANVVSNAQLIANLALYSNTSQMLANDATTYSNAVSYVTAQSYVNTAQLTANLSTVYSNAINAYTSNNTIYTGNNTFNGTNTTFNANVIANNLTVTGILSLTGNTVINGANNLIVENATITLHTLANGAPLTSDDGLNVGIVMNYYSGADISAFLSREHSTGYLAFYSNSTTTGNSVVGGALGTIQANTFAIGNATANATINATNYSQTSNNTLYVGTVTAANVVSNAQLVANLALYSNTAQMLANNATTYSNAVSYVTAQSFVNTSQLSSNLANYQTTAGLNANIASYLPTYTGIVNAASFKANVYGTATGGALVNTTAVAVGNSIANVIIGWNGTDFSLAEFVTNSNNFNEVVVWNANTGNNASADFVVNDTGGPAPTNLNYIDLGINGNGFNQSTWTINGPSDGYLYTGNTNLSIGTAGANYINFFTANTLAVNERMRIAPSGNVGINNTNPQDILSINGTTYHGGNVKIGTGISLIDSTGVQGSIGQVLTSNGSGNVYWSSAASAYIGNNTSYTGNNTFGGTNTVFNSNVTFNAALYTANLIFTAAISLDGGTF
jgi:hypothetical protein